jgi:hypothetical protein
MRDLRLAVPSTDPGPRGARVRVAASWWRNALAISLLVHAVGLYAAGRFAFTVDEPARLPDLGDFFFSVERVVPPPSAPPSAEAPSVVETPSVPPVVEAPAPETREPVAEEAAPPQAAPETLAESIAREAVEEAELPSATDLEEARLRAADEIVAERGAGDSSRTFSIDDVAPPRPVEEPKPKYDIFNPGPGAARRSVGQVGQARTRFGHKVSELCNALTGGFGVGFQGFHLFDACGGPDDEPSGLFPEVRRAYMDMLPECAESEPENPELAAAAPFSTVKCRLVRPVQVERWAYPGQPLAIP